jgi:hypothetical protein
VSTKNENVLSMGLGLNGTDCDKPTYLEKSPFQLYFVHRNATRIVFDSHWARNHEVSEPVRLSHEMVQLYVLFEMFLRNL